MVLCSPKINVCVSLFLAAGGSKSNEEVNVLCCSNANFS